MSDSGNFLTDQIIRSATSREKPYTIRDGRGLFLLVHPNGSKYFQLRVTVAGVRKLIQIGVYPKISIQEARKLARVKVDLLENGAEDKSSDKAQQAFVSYHQATDTGSVESPTTSSDQASVNKTSDEVNSHNHQTLEKEPVASQNSRDLFIPEEMKPTETPVSNTSSYKESRQLSSNSHLYHRETAEQHLSETLTDYVGDKEASQTNQNMESTQFGTELLNAEEELIEPIDLTRPKKIPEVNLTFDQIVYHPRQRTEFIGFFGKLNILIYQKLHQVKKSFIQLIHFVRNQSLQILAKLTFVVVRRIKQFKQSLKYLFDLLSRIFINNIQRIKQNISRFYSLDLARQTLQFPQLILLRIKNKGLRVAEKIITAIGKILLAFRSAMKTLQLVPAEIKSRIKTHLNAMNNLKIRSNHLLSRSRMNHALELRGNYILALLLIVISHIIK